MKQLDLFLSEMGENPAHIAKLEAEMKGLPAPKSSSIRSEVRKHCAVKQLPKREVVEVVPWPPHMRFD